MAWLSSVSEVDAKRSVKPIGTSGSFYATALKEDFDDKFLISYLKLNELLDQLQIKGNDKILLRQYHPQLKTFNTWLISIRYESSYIKSR